MKTQPFSRRKMIRVVNSPKIKPKNKALEKFQPVYDVVAVIRNITGLKVIYYLKKCVDIFMKLDGAQKC